MNCIIDAGNTRIKVAHFEKNELQSLVYFNTLEKVESWLIEHKQKRLLISNVGAWSFKEIGESLNSISLKGPSAYV